MSNGTPDAELFVKEDKEKANKDLLQYLQTAMEDGRKEVIGLQSKLTYTYWIIVTLSVVMFFLGILLLSVPALAAIQGRISELQSVIAAGFGIADLAALFLFRPIERIHGLMGDMSQITLAINSFQAQLALRLLEIDAGKRDTIGTAAEKINDAAKDSIGLIQTYFESRKTG